MNDEKEHIAGLLRRGVSPSVVMAEVRLREVVNGSPASIVQVRRDDLRELLVEYRRLTNVQSPPSDRPTARNMPEFVGGCMSCEYPTPHRHG